MKSKNLLLYPPILVKLALFVLLFSVLNGNSASGQQTEVVNIEIKALIDGYDEIHIKADQIWYDHILYQLPGHFNGADEPTMLNEYGWYAQFDFPEDVEQSSETLAGIVEIPEYSLNYELQLISITDYDPNEDPGMLRSAEQVKITQQPSETNGFELIITLDDDVPSGAAWMHFTIYTEYVIEYEESTTNIQESSTAPTIAVVGPSFLSILLQTYIGLSMMIFFSKYFSSRE